MMLDDVCPPAEEKLVQFFFCLFVFFCFFFNFHMDHAGTVYFDYFFKARPGSCFVK